MQISTSGFFSWLFKLFIIVFVFGVFPTAVVIIAKNYNTKAKSIADVQNALIERQNKLDASNGTNNGDETFRILSSEEATNLQNINSYITGTWNNHADEAEVFSVNPNGNYDEFYTNKKTGYGLWSADVLDGIYFVVKKRLGPTDGGSYFYKIQYLDKDKMVLIKVKKGQSMEAFIKETSSPVANTADTNGEENPNTTTYYKVY